ncbi:MAG: DUF3667 domain-containing protein [Steroidobacterales bacterium]
MNRARCGNCNAPLTGPYCAQCGQHAHRSARSLSVVLHDGWALLTHLDGRFWSTLRRLLSQPGQLTVDYFADRRARYVSPFRLYFVLSIAFFALAAANSNLNSKSAANGQRALTPADLTDLQRELHQAVPAVAEHVTATDEGMDVNLDANDCAKIELRWPWLQGRLRSACQREIADNGKSLAHAFGSYVPKMMFVFLPLMALIMVPLYRTPRRYYVEHLVFFLHTHAALFLVMIGDMLLGMAARSLPYLSGVATAGDVAATCYAVWCVYRAMRRYYGDRRVLTLAKLAVVGIAYQIFLAIMVGATLLLSALAA